MSWIKSSYVVAGIGLVASVFAVIKSAPDAWAAAMRMAGRPVCVSYADAYATTYSKFEHTGADWREVRGGEVAYAFKETGRDLDYIYLQNLTPRPNGESRLKVRLPVCGGMAQLMLPTAQSWKDVVLVKRA